jgi:hypothetical protein
LTCSSSLCKTRSDSCRFPLFPCCTFEWLDRHEPLPPFIRSGLRRLEVVGAETLETLAVHLGMLGADFEVSGPPELLDQLRTLARRDRRATP